MWDQHGLSLEPITPSQSYAAKGFTMVTFQVQSRWVAFLNAGLELTGRGIAPKIKEIVDATNHASGKQPF
jgi:hypothetical protein